MILVTLALIVAAGYVSRLPWDQAYHARTEQGVIEGVTVVFYGCACVISLALFLLQRWTKGIYAAVILLALGLRELDFDARFTPEQIDSIRYWRLADVPLLQKLGVALLLVALLFVLLRFLKGSAIRLREDLGRRRAYAITLVGIGVYLTASYVIDNQLDTARMDMIQTGAEQGRKDLFFSLLEECIELGIPLLACLSLMQMAMQRRLDAGYRPVAPPWAARRTDSERRVLD